MSTAADEKIPPSTLGPQDTSKDMRTSTCANCGKEGTTLNICNRCHLVSYCNAACKKKHRTKHKKKCDRRAAELHEINLFKQPLPSRGCEICMLPLPSLNTGWKYMVCCGKTICAGCIHAPVYDNEGKEIQKKLCPLCRTPNPTTGEEEIKRNKKRVKINDAIAMNELGCYYSTGLYDMPQAYKKALELWHRSGELGNAEAYYNIGSAYISGNGVEKDEKKANHYYEKAAIGGDSYARYNLGNAELRTGNMDRALKHYMIAAGFGYKPSLNVIENMFKKGYTTKDDFAKALRSYQEYLGEIKSDQRDKAAAYSDQYKYY